MKTCTILQLASLLVFLLVASTEALFFQYHKNALMHFFQSLHGKKEPKKPQNIHHYHLHYYPVHSHILTHSIKAPKKQELDKLHGNHLESLGWSDHEYKNVPEPDIYRVSPPLDAWPEASISQPLSWQDQNPEYLHYSPSEVHEVSKPGIVVQVPLHQKIIIQQPAAKEKEPVKNPLTSFLQKIHTIKNTLFSHREEKSETDCWWDNPSYRDISNAYGVVYVPHEIDRQD